MTDITQTNLELAILDQQVAGTFGGVAFAYMAVPGGDGWMLGVAVANERGYHPLNKSYKTSEEAHAIAAGMNAHIGRSERDATRIIVSTMGGQRYIADPGCD